MNILYCIPHLYNSGGMERVLTQKVNWLAAHTGHTLSIVTTERVPEGEKAVYFQLDKRVQLLSLPIDFNADYSKPLLSKWIGHMRKMRQYKKALNELIRREQIELCISMGGKEIAFLSSMPCRTIAEMHFAKEQRQQLLMANHSNRLWAWLGQIRTRQLVRAVKPLERLVVLTEKDKRDWQTAGCRNVVCIPNPCCLDGRKLPMESKKKTVLAVGRLHEQKGFDRLLQAWQPVEQRHPDWSLRIVGEGPQRAALEQQIHDMSLQQVVLAGQSNDVVAEYRSASLFVLSSRYEGLPLALIEAMWCGVPCVAFDCPHGPAELLADHRGWMVPNGDTTSLSQQIESVINHPEEAATRAQSAQTYAQQTYSESVIMPKWLQIINLKS